MDKENSRMPKTMEIKHKTPQKNTSRSSVGGVLRENSNGEQLGRKGPIGLTIQQSKLSEIEEVEEEYEQSQIAFRNILDLYKNMNLVPQKPKESPNVMERICSFLSFRLIKPLNSTEERFLELGKIKISGKKQEWGLLYSIYNKLTYEQATKTGSHWQKLGLPTQPIGGLKQTNVLVLVQWSNFVLGNLDQGQKVFNLMREIQYSLLQFHSTITSIFCSFVEKRKIQFMSWEHALSIYDDLAINAYKEIKNVISTDLHKEQNIPNWVKVIRNSARKYIKKTSDRQKECEQGTAQAMNNNNIDMFQIDDLDHDLRLTEKKSSVLALCSSDNKYLSHQPMGDKHEINLKPTSV